MREKDKTETRLSELSPGMIYLLLKEAAETIGTGDFADVLRKSCEIIDELSRELSEARTQGANAVAILERLADENTIFRAQVATLREACNQARLALAGYVDRQSAIDALDCATDPAPR